MVIQLRYDKEIIYKFPVSKYIIYVIRGMGNFFVYTSIQ